MFKSVQQQEVCVESPMMNSIVDSTQRGFEPSSLCYPLCQALIDDWILVSEDEVVTSLVQLIENKGIVVEGAAAMAYAGCLKYLDQVVFPSL
jgi:threonine dehydratase